MNLSEQEGQVNSRLPCQSDRAIDTNIASRYLVILDSLLQHWDTHFAKFQVICILTGVNYWPSLPGIGLQRAYRQIPKQMIASTHISIVFIDNLNKDYAQKFAETQYIYANQVIKVYNCDQLLALVKRNGTLWYMMLEWGDAVCCFLVQNWSGGSGSALICEKSSSAS